MEWIWIIAGIILVLAGVAGSILPALPGPPVAYAGLLLQQLREPNPFSTRFLMGWLAIIIVVTILDYYIPIWGTKKFGGSKYGMWGCTLGFIAAFWMGPWGVIIGPFIGAFIGELIAKKPQQQALKAAFGAFIGFLGGSAIKILVCFVMGYYLITSI
ncbi:MAG: DUF456 domain-containing protein [Chitinophagaceae bacterium]|jgi:hypothetical protein|nr:DUF456 domain-containing protein [Chitinophagaceae bacterium]MCU0404755.1 DUF456 domain-containing protein [Chitinophagaceae bacterium]